MPRLWVGGAEAEIDARSTYFKREKGRTTHCIHSDFIIKTSFTKFVNMFSFFRPIMKRIFHPLMSFSAIFKLYQVTNAFLNSNIKLQRDIWLVEINKSINSPISQRTSTLRVNVVCFGAVFLGPVYSIPIYCFLFFFLFSIFGKKTKTLSYLFAIIAICQITESLLFETLVVESWHVYTTTSMWTRFALYFIDRR